MNGTPATNKNIIAIIITTLSFNSTIGLCILGYCLLFQVKPDQVLLTAFVAMVNYLLGVISGILSKTSPTETAKAPTPDAPAPVTVMNRASDPVPTTEQTIDKPFAL